MALRNCGSFHKSSAEKKYVKYPQEDRSIYAEADLDQDFGGGGVGVLQCV
jgi:hypothetical protein